MEDEELLLQAANCPTFYLDGFGSFRKINGVLRCVGYVIGNGAQLNLVVSLTGAEAGIVEARRTLDEPGVKGLRIWNGVAMAH